MTPDSLNVFTVTVTSQSVLWKYTYMYLNERTLMDDKLPLAFKRCGFESGTLSFFYLFVRFFRYFVQKWIF